MQASVAIQRLRDAVQELINHRFRELASEDAQHFIKLRLSPPLSVGEESQLRRHAITACVATGIEREQYETVVSDAQRVITSLRGLQTCWRGSLGWEEAFRQFDLIQDEHRMWQERAEVLAAEIEGFELRVQTAVSANCSAVSQKCKKKARGKNINALMLSVMSENAEAIGWTAQQWALHLDCSDGTVKGTKAWNGVLKNARVLFAAESSENMDRSTTSPRGRRKTRHKSTWSE